jgi:hypothetical protein
MGYGHAERDLALIRRLEAGTRQLPASGRQPDHAVTVLNGAQAMYGSRRSRHRTQLAWPARLLHAQGTRVRQSRGLGVRIAGGLWCR